MRKTRTINCIFATIAMIVGSYVPASAQYLGTLPKDQEYTLEFTNSSNDVSAVTVYHIDRRGLDVVAVISVPAAGSFRHTFPKPGSGVRRIIVEVDPPPGGRVEFRVNDSSTINIDGSGRLVFDVV